MHLLIWMCHIMRQQLQEFEGNCVRLFKKNNTTVITFLYTRRSFPIAAPPKPTVFALSQSGVISQVTHTHTHLKKRVTIKIFIVFIFSFSWSPNLVTPSFLNRLSGAAQLIWEFIFIYLQSIFFNTIFTTLVTRTVMLTRILQALDLRTRRSIYSRPICHRCCG